MNVRTSPWSAIALLTISVGLGARPASAQVTSDTGSGLLLGPVIVRPVFTLREAGWDSNIFNEAGADGGDNTAVASGRADARLRVGLVQIDSSGGADYLYFERFTGERGLNGFAGTRLQPQFVRVRPFVAGGYRRTRDRATSEIDVRAPRTEHEHSAGLETQLARRVTIEASLRRAFIRFDEGEEFRDINLATRLNRQSNIVDVSFRYELSPLTSVTVGASFVRDEFSQSTDRNMDTLNTTAGFNFAPDAIVRGRAVVGFRDIRPRGALSVPSRGPTAGIELSYTLLDRTIFAGRFLRETTVSVEDHPYYLSTLSALEISHNIVGPLDIVARVSRERLEYEAITAFALPAHLDRVGAAGGGVALRLGPHMKIAANYEEVQRRSDLPDVRDYDRRRLYTTISYGF